jgi:hypothetical protein
VPKSIDLIAAGEAAARQFVRGTKKMKQCIEPMARGLAEARKRYPSDSKFGGWLRASPYSDINRSDRAALIKIGANWNDDLAARLAKLDSYSPELIARVLFRESDDGYSEVGITLDRRDRTGMKKVVFLIKDRDHAVMRQAAFDMKITMQELLRRSLKMYLIANDYDFPAEDAAPRATPTSPTERIIL